MLKIGVIGAGHLGKIHIKLLKENEKFELVGFYDADLTNAAAVSASMEVPAYDTIDALIADVDAIDIVTPTLSHYECAVSALRSSKHVFIEKPVTNTVEEAKSLMSLAKEAQVKIQVGHVERFNPAFTEVREHIDRPMFIETHRLAQFNPRGTDVPVVLDLMIHDIDIILSVVKSNVKRISASGVSVISDTPDIANARLEFDNGCVANLTASRISLKNMRKSRFFQKDAYITVDFLEKKSEVLQMETIEGEPGDFDIVFDLGEGKPKKRILMQNPEIKHNNAIQDELTAFAVAIETDTTPIVSIEDGYNALSIATQIVEKLRSSHALMNP